MSEMQEKPPVDTVISEKNPPNVWSVAAAVLVVVVSSLIAFCCTCYPLGNKAFMMGIGIDRSPEIIKQSNEQMSFAFKSGGVAALVVGAITSFLFWKSLKKRR